MKDQPITILPQWSVMENRQAEDRLQRQENKMNTGEEVFIVMIEEDNVHGAPFISHVNSIWSTEELANKCAMNLPNLQKSKLYRVDVFENNRVRTAYFFEGEEVTKEHYQTRVWVTSRTIAG